MLLVDKDRHPVKSIESKYAKSKNKYYKLFQLNSRYKIDLRKKKQNSLRYLMIAEKVGDRYICFQITSKRKSNIYASPFPGKGINGIDIWVSYESIWFNDNQIRKWEKRIIVSPIMIAKHMNNIQRNSTKTNPYYKRYLKVKLHLIQLEERQHGKKIKSQ